MCMQAVEGGVCILAAFLCCECRSLEVGGHMVCVCVAPSSWQQWFGGDTLSFLSLKTTHHYCSPTNHPSLQLRKARPLSPSFFTLYHPFLLQHFLLLFLLWSNLSFL